MAGVSSINDNTGQGQPSIVNREQYEHLSNFVIKVGEKAFKCHKLQLAKSSEFFNNMFMHECQENRNNEMTIEDFDEDTVANFIAFLYEGKLYDKEIHGNGVLVILGGWIEMDRYSPSLMVMADKYQVSELKAKCTFNLLHNLTCDNIVEVWKAAELIQNQNLVSAAHEFVAKNWSNEKCVDAIKDLIRLHPDFSFGLMNLFQAKFEEVGKELIEHKKEIDRKDRTIARQNVEIATKNEQITGMQITIDDFNAAQVDELREGEWIEFEGLDLDDPNFEILDFRRERARPERRNHDAQEGAAPQADQEGPGNRPRRQRAQRGNGVEQGGGPQMGQEGQGNRPRRQGRNRPERGNGAQQGAAPQAGQEGEGDRPAPRRREIERELQRRVADIRIRRDLVERRQHREGREQEARRGDRERRERSRSLSPQPPAP